MGSERLLTRRAFLHTGLGLAGVGLIAACSPPAAPAKPGEAVKPAAPAAAPGASVAPAAKPAAATSAPSGRVIIMYGAEPASLDTQMITSGATRIAAFDNVVEAMVGVGPDMEMTPGLATSWEQLEPTRMRFKLRQGIKFHNGEPFTSAAVVAAVKRILDPANNSQVVSNVDTVTQAEPVDDYTVDIITKGPDPVLPRRMSFMGLMAPEFLAKTPDAASTAPIGTGPYQVVEWVKGQHLLLTANEAYWGDPKPTIKEVEFLPRAESAVRLTALKVGETHLIANVPPEDAATLPKEQVVSGVSIETMLIRPNSKGAITGDVRVRQAMQYALDRAAIVKDILGGYGAVPNGQLYNSATFGYDPNMKDYPFDLDKAQQLIKEAGAEGKTLSINGESANRWLKDREVQQVVAAMLEKAGLKIDLQFREVGEWSRIGYEVENPPVDIHFTSAGNDQVDPDRILVAYASTGGRSSTYSNPELDQIIAASRAELDQNKRAALLRQIAAVIRDQAVVVPIVQPLNVYGVSPKLQFKPKANAQLPANRMAFTS
jgi:peptide/nickel transport system substrate-binding protein